jgi:7-carboxy-7-deazaguanine synthase
MRICEIYESVQGEGLLTGSPSVFVRTSGCNLRCIFCDTPYASWQPEGQTLSVDEVAEQVKSFPSQHVVITGGEPMIDKGLPELCDRLHELKFHITIETAGTVYQELHCDLMSISPKMANSTPTIEQAGDWSLRHESTRHRPDIVQQLMDRYEHQLKFVINTMADAEEGLAYTRSLARVKWDRVLMMPQGITVGELAERAAWMVDWCRVNNVRFSDRAHIHWFGQKRGT